MKIASKEYVIKKLTTLMITPKKKYSQNFLVDYDIVKKSVDELDLKKEEVIIEIGPGLGALTQELLDRGNEVYAYEIDEDMYNHLKETFTYYNNLHLFKADFMKVDLSLFSNKKVKVISNVPYNLTTPIIEKILTSSLDIECFEFMVQKEVYERIKAKKGNKDYSPLNIIINYLGTLSLVLKVPKDRFVPSPNVDSCILKLEFNKKRIEPDQEKELFRIINACFFQRRKTILNNLTIYLGSKEKAKILLELSQIDERVRGEQLDLENYLILSKNALIIKK